MARQPRGRPGIYKGADNWYHSYVMVGHKPDGTPDRKHVRRKTETECAIAVAELETRVKDGDGVPTKIVTVEDWFAYWLAEVVKPRRAWKTWAGYRSIAKLHIVPYIGKRRMDGNRNRLEPEHVEVMFNKLTERVEAGELSSSYVHAVYRCFRTAMRAAKKRRKTTRKIWEMIDPPESRPIQIRAHSLEEAEAIIRTAAADPLAARWLIGMLLGLRQGEVLGLRWFRLHLDASPNPYLRVEKQLQRRSWEHGCADPVACAAPRCRRKKCPPKHRHGCQDEGACKKLARFCPRKVRLTTECSRHQRACPSLCPPKCTDHARSCPQRKGGGLVEVKLKTAKSERDAILPAELVEALRRHREEQIRQCGERGVEWDPEGLVFVDERGNAIDPRRDHIAWEQLLVRAGLPDSRLHTARHDAGTLMLATGTDIRVVQELLGHVKITTTQQYVHVANELKRQAVDRVAAALFNGALGGILQQSPATVHPRG